MWYKHFVRNEWRDFRLPTSVLARSTEEFTAKIDFTIGHFMLPFFADPDIESRKYLRTLFDKYLDLMLLKFEQNRMVRTIQDIKLFDKRWLTIFDIVLTPFWMTFL